MPVRKIPRSYRNLTGRVAFRGKSIAFESRLERDFYRLMDFDPDVADVEEQPVEVPYVDEFGRRSRCYPDALVTYVNLVRKPMLFEIKDRETLFEDWSSLKPKLKAARAYAKSRGWKHKIMTEVEIRTPYLGNVQFLRSYRSIEVDHLHRQRLLNALRFAEEWTIHKLTTAVAAEARVEPAAMLTVVWHLVSIGDVVVDLRSAELCMDSPVAARRP